MYKCPHCGKSEFLVTTTVTIWQRGDAWDVCTPFKYKDSDLAECQTCEQLLTVKEIRA